MVAVNFSSWNSADYATSYWVKSVSKTGVFFCPTDLPVERGYSGIPEGWNILPIADLDKFYSIKTSDNYITIDKSSAQIRDEIHFAIKDRTNDGYILRNVYLNDNAISKVDFEGTIKMLEHAENVTISTKYNHITTDEYTHISGFDRVFNIIKLNFTQRPGYRLTKVTYQTSDGQLNSKALSDYETTINMPDDDITISSVYTLYNFSVTPYDQYVSVDKSTATINDIVNITIADRSSENYALTRLLVNGNEISVNNYTAQFAMADYLKDVEIQAEYSYSGVPSNTYTISTDKFCSADKSSATINDVVNITITDRSSENYTLIRLLVNGNEVNVKDYTAQFAMSDYLTNITVKAEYTYTGPQAKTYIITTSEYCTADKSSATEGEVVTLTFAHRDGYDLNEAYYNGILLSINNNQATFTMPAEDVSVNAEYTEVNITKYYNVSTDQYSSTDKTQYAQGETVSVTFSKRDGYNLESATINNTALNLNGYSATFKMPSNDVSIVAEYKKIENPVEYTITNTSEYVSVSTPTAKPGDEVSVFVSRRDGYTPHVFVNGAEVLINGNVAKYIQPSASVVITVDYKKDATTAVTEISGNNPAVSVYPNPARQGEKIVISIEGGIDLKNAKILIYNTHGALVKRIDHAAEYNELNLKSGIYNGVLIYKNGRQSFRIAVY